MADIRVSPTGFIYIFDESGARTVERLLDPFHLLYAMKLIHHWEQDKRRKN